MKLTSLAPSPCSCLSSSLTPIRPPSRPLRYLDQEAFVAAVVPEDNSSKIRREQYGVCASRLSSRRLSDSPSSRSSPPSCTWH